MILRKFHVPNLYSLFVFIPAASGGFPIEESPASEKVGSGTRLVILLTLTTGLFSTSRGNQLLHV